MDRPSIDLKNDIDSKCNEFKKYSQDDQIIINSSEPIIQEIKILNFGKDEVRFIRLDSRKVDNDYEQLVEENEEYQYSKNKFINKVCKFFCDAGNLNNIGTIIMLLIGLIGVSMLGGLFTRNQVTSDQIKVLISEQNLQHSLLMRKIEEQATIISLLNMTQVLNNQNVSEKLLNSVKTLSITFNSTISEINDMLSKNIDDINKLAINTKIINITLLNEINTTFNRCVRTVMGPNNGCANIGDKNDIYPSCAGKVLLGSFTYETISDCNNWSGNVQLKHVSVCC